MRGKTRHTVFIVGLALLLLTAALYVGVSLLDRGHVVEVQGRVAGFSEDHTTVIVEHEDVPGYMPAMTMPFSVQDPSELEGLRVGDAVRFRLVVRAEQSWIEQVEHLPEDALPLHPAAEGRPTLDAQDGTPTLEVGDVVPDFQLTDQDGEPLRLADYRGRTLVLTFIYTRCPVPDFCPLMSRNFQRLQAELEAASAEQVQLLSISFDPEHDTPEVLRDYATRYTDDLTNWTFATSSPAEIGRATTLFGVFTEEAEGQIVHNLTTALVGSDGRILKLWRGNDWKPAAVLAALKSEPDEP